jgi:hypothetical protein
LRQIGILGIVEVEGPRRRSQWDETQDENDHPVGLIFAASFDDELLFRIETMALSLFMVYRSDVSVLLVDVVFYCSLLASVLFGGSVLIAAWRYLSLDVDRSVRIQGEQIQRRLDDDDSYSSMGDNHAK